MGKWVWGEWIPLGGREKGLNLAFRKSRSGKSQFYPRRVGVCRTGGILRQGKVSLLRPSAKDAFSFLLAE